MLCYAGYLTLSLLEEVLATASVQGRGGAAVGSASNRAAAHAPVGSKYCSHMHAQVGVLTPYQCTQGICGKFEAAMFKGTNHRPRQGEGGRYKIAGQKPPPRSAGVAACGTGGLGEGPAKRSPG